MTSTLPDEPTAMCRRKYTSGSYRGPEFDSQHPHHAAHNGLSLLASEVPTPSSDLHRVLHYLKTTFK